MSEFEDLEMQPEQQELWNAVLPRGQAILLGRDPRSVRLSTPPTHSSENDDVALKVTSVLSADRLRQPKATGREPDGYRTDHRGAEGEDACQCPVGGYRYFACCAGPFRVGPQCFGCSLR